MFSPYFGGSRRRGLISSRRGAGGRRRQGANIAIASWFEGADVAWFLTTPTLEVLEANARARAILDAGDALASRDGVLVAAQAGDQGLLDALAAAPQPLRRFLVLRGGAQAAALVVRAHPLAEGVPGYWLELWRAGAIHEGELPDFAHLFGFTRSEAALVRPLLRGEAPDHIARTQGLSVETVRTHLKNAYAKAGVSGRSEFIGRLIAFLR